MYALSEEIDVPALLLEEYKSLAKKFFENLNVVKSNTLITSTENLFSDPELKGKLFVITSGSIAWSRNEASLLVLEPGDIIGIEEGWGVGVGAYSTEFAVHADSYDVSEIKKAISQDQKLQLLWTTFLTSRMCFLNAIFLSLLKGEKKFIPSIRSYQKGDSIIVEGTSGEEVFTLLGGHADVLVDGVRVGEIFTDEIFGALAALTDLPRTATVVATEDCRALAVTKGNFLDLMQSRPAIVFKMVEDMARAIVDLNKQVVGKLKFFR